jgi:6-O-methylguanine DNA methyltransferase, DNA binding domain
MRQTERMKAPTLAPNPWSARLQAKKLPKRVRLEKDFAGIKSGSMLFVGTPQIVEQYLRRIPEGQTRTVERMRRELARRHDCDAMCPVSTAIFLRVCAEAAIEQMNAAGSATGVIPFWRVIEPQSTLARKLSVDAPWIALQREAERS